MVEYLAAPAVALLLLAGLGVHFLMGSFTYGPMSRRVLARLAVPAGAVGCAVGYALPWREPLTRVAVGVGAGGACYLALAVAVVLRLRERKLALLVGDIRRLRRRVAARQREAERLFWQAGPGVSAAPAAQPAPVAPRAAPVPATGGAPRAEGTDLTLAVRVWQQAAGPREARARAARVAEWRHEFRRLPAQELLARARVLEAARDDAPPDHRGQHDARLALLWTVYGERRGPPHGGTAGPPGGREPCARERWEVARRDVGRLLDELAAMRRQRATLLQRRLPLD